MIIVMTILAVVKKPSSVYQDKPEEQNSMEGKKVIFVENESESENADGIRGHLEAVGDPTPDRSIYGGYIKRIINIVLSFCRLVVLSPVFLILSLWIVADNPGPVLFTQKRVGKNKQYFRLHKFRSMKMSTPHDKLYPLSRTF